MEKCIQTTAPALLNLIEYHLVPITKMDSITDVTVDTEVLSALLTKAGIAEERIEGLVKQITQNEEDKRYVQLLATKTADFILDLKQNLTSEVVALAKQKAEKEHHLSLVQRAISHKAIS